VGAAPDPQKTNDDVRKRATSNNGQPAAAKQKSNEQAAEQKQAREGKQNSASSLSSK